MRISVVGLGKLGLPLAAVLASKGHIVIGVDTDASHVRALNGGECPIKETGLAELLGAGRMPHFTTDIRGAVEVTDATFIVVPTPSLPSGAFSLEHVLSAGEEIGRGLKGKDGYHLVALVSTVMPGGTKQLQTVLECGSGHYCGDSFGLCYNPEFIALGSVIHDLLNPDMVLIGESDAYAGGMLGEIYKGMGINSLRIVYTSFVNAEIARLAINTYVTTKISYANMIAELCERVPGADSVAVLGAVGNDSRIGHKYLKGALGYGGPCFPRDNQALMTLAEEAGMRLPIAGATKEVNRRQVRRIVDMIPAQSRVGILGLTYKPGTSVMEESQGVRLAAALQKWECRVLAYDPTQPPGCLPSAQECIRQSDIVVIATPWPEFANISAEGRRVKLIDCWRILRPERIGEFEYVAVGKGPDA